MAIDILERTAHLLGKSEWDLFVELCECSQVDPRRRDMFWDAWCGEDFIPTFIEEACAKILMGTVFN
jgi:hypothetical protein